jgi:hypothetical protein
MGTRGGPVIWRIWKSDLILGCRISRTIIWYDWSQRMYPENTVHYLIHARYGFRVHCPGNLKHGMVPIYWYMRNSTL